MGRQVTQRALSPGSGFDNVRSPARERSRRPAPPPGRLTARVPPRIPPPRKRPRGDDDDRIRRPRLARRLAYRMGRVHRGARLRARAVTVHARRRGIRHLLRSPRRARRPRGPAVARGLARHLRLSLRSSTGSGRRYPRIDGSGTSPAGWTSTGAARGRRAVPAAGTLHGNPAPDRTPPRPGSAPTPTSR